MDMKQATTRNQIFWLAADKVSRKMVFFKHILGQKILKSPDQIMAEVFFSIFSIVSGSKILICFERIGKISSNLFRYLISRVFRTGN